MHFLLVDAHSTETHTTKKRTNAQRHNGQPKTCDLTSALDLQIDIQDGESRIAIKCGRTNLPSRARSEVHH